MHKVKALLAAGATLSEAVRSAFGVRSMRLVCIEHGGNVGSLSSALSGGRLATDRDVSVLVGELGGTAQEWRALLGEAMRRRADAAVAESAGTASVAVVGQ